jgi:hypothetical protein
MGLLDGTTQNQYYQGENHGGYQFISLQELIAQFEIAYVGEGKLIPKLNKLDMQFHAMRALQELSFDTFKSFKSQQIDVPPSLIMPLPQDYVNYTKISSVDSAGIKHLLYPVKETNNPFQIKQSDDKSYFFGAEENNVTNPNFEVPFTFTNDSWLIAAPGKSKAWSSFNLSGSGKYYAQFIKDEISLINDELVFKILWENGANQFSSRAYGCWQRIDVELATTIDLSAVASSGAQQTDDSGNLLCDFGVVRVGITSTDPIVGWTNPSSGHVLPATNTAPYVGSPNETPNKDINNYDLGYIEWSDGTTSEKVLEDIDVSAHTEVWVYIQAYSPWQSVAGTSLTQGAFVGGTTQPLPTTSVNNTHQENSVDFVSVIVPGQNLSLSSANEDGNSSTWNNYKAHTPSENNNPHYEDYAKDVYWPNHGERYGLNPKHAQVNGSFYIDNLRGKINFSSNISGKTVILDYISDSLGTDAEMQVHKLAEEAMYKHIACAVLSTSGNPMHQQLVPRFKKEKFAAVRQAKLRLSNIKLEELTQVLRGKSKQIKH